MGFCCFRCLFYLVMGFVIVCIFYRILMTLVIHITHRYYLDGGGGNNGLSLDEVVLHEALEVEVRQLIRGLGLEESGQLAVGDNDASVGLVLQLVGADVLVDLAAHGSACHLGSLGLAKEGGELVTDQGGLDETRGGTVSSASLLDGGLLGGLDLAGEGLLEGLEITLQRGEDAGQLLEFGAELVHLLVDGGLGLSNNNLVGQGGSSSGINDGGGLLDGSSGLSSLLGCLLCRGSRSIGDGRNNRCGNSGGSGLLVSLRGSYHSNLYYV